MARDEGPVVLTFGGGLNARRRTADVHHSECVDTSINFDLDAQYHAFKRRKPFDLVATTPNAGSIDGYAQLIKQDGSVSTLIQSGTNVYEWDGTTSFTLAGTVAAGTKLRGPREHNFTLDEFVIVTDLGKKTVVKKWDGTTFADFDHNLGASFYAKYCRIHRERAFFANIKTTTDTPHVVLGSEVGDAEQLSNANRPSSSLGLDAAFFIVVPDLRPINGLEAAFGQFLISTERGRLYILAGASAFDFDINEFHVGSAVVGDEAMRNIGNDVVMGLPGRIETLSGTLNFGDVESNDLSLAINSLIDNQSSWTIEYDRRLQRVYCFPGTQGAVYVMYKPMLSDPAAQGLSPWSKWETEHDIDFTPTTIMALVDPVNSNDVVYFGDASGNIYVFDGDGGQDGGSSDITAKRRSGLITIPEGNIFDITGWIHYRKLFDTTVTLTILGGGVAVYDQEIQLLMPGNEAVSVYNGDSEYYGDPDTLYGSTFSQRIYRQDWAAAGHSSHIQVEVSVTSGNEWDIQEVGVEFRTVDT